MKKKILLFLAATLLMIFTLAGCGGFEYGREEYYQVQFYVDNDEDYVFDVPVGKKYEYLDYIPHKPGHTFLGLYDSRDGGICIFDADGKATVDITDSVTLYAKWKPREYNFVFDANGGVLNDSERETVYGYGSNVDALPVPKLDGYEFLGWKNSNGNLISDAGVPKDTYRVLDYSGYDLPMSDDGNGVYTYTLTAEWTIETYEIIFEYNDPAIENATAVLQYNEQFTADLYPENIDTGSKEVVGWTASYGSGIPFDGNLNSDITLFAIWKDYKKVTVYEQIDGEPKEMRVYRNEPFYIPERGGYNFTGWYSNSTMGGLPIGTVSYTNVPPVIYASWDMATYSINFVTDTGSIQTMYYTIEDMLTLPTVSKDNYTFVGWCDNEELTGTPRIIIRPGSFGNLTLYPCFKGDDRVVNFDAAGGVIGLSSQKVEYGAIVKLNVPILEGYAFVGWFDGDGNQITDRNGVSYEKWFYDGDVFLTARYDEKYYIYVTDSITGSATQFGDFYLEGDQVIVMCDSVTGYDFDGFYSSSGRLESITLEFIMIMPAEDVYLTAKYTPKQYTVLLDSDGGICKKTEMTVTYGESVVFPTVYKEGYNFIGWRFSDWSYDGDATLTDASGALTNQSGKWERDSGATLVPYFKEDTSGSIAILDAAGFASMSSNPGGSYKLVADIDMTGISYVPFEFSGTLEGNGFTVKNLSISTQSGDFGIFTKVSGKISNITFENITVSTTSYGVARVGGVCGELTGSLNRVIFKGTVSGQGGDSTDIGGLVGMMSAGAITYCENYATVIGNATEATGTTGGIVAYITGGSISGCTNFGAISGTYRTGGLVGLSYIFHDGLLVNNGTVRGTDFVGGVFGRVEKGAGSYSATLPLENNGQVTGVNRVGGVIGHLENGSHSYSNYYVSIMNFSNTASVVGDTYVGGIAGSMRVINGGYTTIAEITNFSNVGNVTGATRVGGLFGYYEGDDTTVKNSASSAVITAECYVGGLAGEAYCVMFNSCSNLGSTIVATGYIINGADYDAYIGGLAGYGYSAKNCENSVRITYDKQGRFVGGLFGKSYAALTNCKNNAEIYAPKAFYVGGISGCDEADGSLSHSNLTNIADVTGVNCVGGIFGQINNNAGAYTDYTLNLVKFTNHGNIVGTSYVGGIIGYCYAVNSGYATHTAATSWTNTGNATGGDYVGGFVGYTVSDGDSYIKNSTSAAAVTANYYVGGLVGYAENVAIDTCSNEGSTVIANGYFIDGTSYKVYVGGYVGYGYSVKNCINNVEITYTDRGDYVGGIIGYSYGNLEKCENRAKVTATKSSYVGGVAGCCGATGSPSFLTLTNTGDITGNNCVGGIIGRLENRSGAYTTYTMTAVELSNSGDVSGNEYVAGNIAYLYVDNWYSVILAANSFDNSGNISGKCYVGGCLGYAETDDSASYLVNASSSGVITAEYYVGCIAGYLSSIALKESSIEGSTINITGALINDGKYYTYAGGYLGYGWSVSDCNNDGVSITVSQNGNYIGGIVGYCYGDVKNCTNKSDVYAPKANHVGGIVGYHAGTGSITLQNLTNDGNVTGADYIGGIVGGINDRSGAYSTYTFTFSQATNTGAVVGKQYVGGIAGYLYLENWYSTILRGSLLTNEGSVTGVTNVGGLMAYCATDDGSSTIVGYISTGKVSGESTSQVVVEASNVKIEQ